MDVSLPQVNMHSYASPIKTLLSEENKPWPIQPKKMQELSDLSTSNWINMEL